MTRTINLKLIAMLAAVTGAGVIVGMGTAHAQSTDVNDYTTEELLEICTEKRTMLFETKELLMADLTAANAELRDLKTNGVGGELDRVKKELADTQKSLNTQGALYQKYFKLWQDTSMDKHRVTAVTAERDALQERIDALPRYNEAAGHSIKTTGTDAYVPNIYLNDGVFKVVTSSYIGGSVEIHVPRTFIDSRDDGCTGEDADFSYETTMGTLNGFTTTDNENSRIFELDVGPNTTVVDITGTCTLGV